MSSGPIRQRMPIMATPAADRRKSPSPMATPLGLPVVPEVYSMVVGQASPTTSTSPAGALASAAS
nr:hypothetical protein [Rhabdothermincola sediminis]